MPDIEWENSGYSEEPNQGVNVPELHIPLTDHDISELKQMIDPLQHSDCFGIDIYLTTVQYVESLTEVR